MFQSNPRFPQKLNTRHNEIIRLSFLGKKGEEIAEAVGMSKSAVYCILRSPLAQAALAELAEKANDSLTNVPARVQFHDRINRAAELAMAHTELVLSSPLGAIDIKEKGRTARHILDRGVFDKNEDGEEKVSYRELLREIREVNTKMGSGTYLLPSVNGYDGTVKNSENEKGAA